MSRPRIPNSRKAHLEHKKRIEQYCALIQKVYDSIAKDAAMKAALADPATDMPFSFSDYPLTKQAFTKLQSQLMSELSGIIMRGTSEEWNESNLVQNLVARKVLTAYTGTSKIGEEYTRYFQTNPDALKAFQDRKDEGMNLSSRVWNLSEQFKGELEEAITASIAPGVSAVSLAADVKKYLKEPEKRFRRIKEKMEDGTIKWHLSKPAKAYHPGRGVYRSSARNAQRLARTEINMAYRTAEQTRWRQFDFVVGYEVKTTQNGHHVEDICDLLAGKYPKSFEFKGWHPQCMCYAIPLLKTEEEFWTLDDNEKSVNEVTELPPNFREWIEDNKDRIKAAEERGKLPYFIRDNRDDVENILNPKPKETPLEIAAERHAARTPEDIARIRTEWSNRRINILWDAIGDELLPSECTAKIEELKDDILFGDFDEFNRKYRILSTAMSRHANRIPEECQSIQDSWDAKKKRDQQTKMVAENVLKVAKGWSEIDYSALEQFKADNNLTAMKSESKAVANAIKAMKAEEKALSDIIPDVHKWHDTFTLSELQATKDAVLKTISTLDQSTLEKFKANLQFEADWVIKHSSYATKYVAEAAYKNQIGLIDEKIYWRDNKSIADKLLESISYTNPKISKKWEEEIKWAVTNSNKSYLETCIEKLNKWDKIINLESALTKDGSIDVSVLQKYIKEGKINKAWSEYQKLNTTVIRIDFEEYCKKHYRTDFDIDSQESYKDRMPKLIADCYDAWVNAPKEERKAIIDYTGSFSEEMIKDRAFGRNNDRVKHLDSLLDKITLKEDLVLRSGQDFCVPGFIFGNDFETILRSEDISELNRRFAGAKGVNNAYMSTSYNEKGGFRSKDIEFHIFAPKGTNGMVANQISQLAEDRGVNWDAISHNDKWEIGESEFLLHGGLIYQFIKAELGTTMCETGIRLYIQILGKK